MNAQVEDRSLEAEIADCCNAIYWATEPAVALHNWQRLKRLRDTRADEEYRQFLREAACLKG